jgi:CheY-like chemotaxis protein
MLGECLVDNGRPLAAHPCTWFFLDDETRFLESVALVVPADQPISLHDVPVALLDLLRKLYTSLAPSNLEVVLDLDDAWGIINNPNRFSLPSVLVVDYAMPSIDGLEFCQELADIPIKKILLTGVADEKIATNAFNDGLIDRFIRKSDQNALEDLLKHSRELTGLVMEERFPFQGIDEDLRNLFQRSTQSRQFQKFLFEYSIVEHYLCTNPCGILGVDKKGKASFFALDRSVEPENLRYAPDTIRSAVRERRVLTGLFESIPDKDQELTEYDWTFNSVALNVIDDRTRYGVHEAPPLSVDYSPEAQSLSSFLERIGSRRV